MDYKTARYDNLIGKGATSYVKYNPTLNAVKKQNVSFQDYNIFDREVYWLRYLNEKGYTWCPKLLDIDPENKCMYLEYRGVPINKHNAPVDWKKQLTQILSDLNVEKICHNDIKNTELLVLDEKLSLVDYGWASMGLDWSCGKKFPQIEKPHHSVHDDKAIHRIQAKLSEPDRKPPMGFSVAKSNCPTAYKNSQRRGVNGSQQEVPKITHMGNKCMISGYQCFSITRDTIIMNGNYRNKFLCIDNFLKSKLDSCKSITDIGASNGIVSFHAIQAGYTIVHALDHDTQCIQLLETVKKKFNYEGLLPKVYSFGDPHESTDIVIACALIHWIYSCTALYGDFDSITNYLRDITGTYLIIEWVNPNDPAIKFFNHISYNKDIIKEPYTKENFVASLTKKFGTVDKLLQVTPSRELYLCTV